MKCPICEENLVMADRQGIEIDYCPKCRGVWLDRGELDKITRDPSPFLRRSNVLKNASQNATMKTTREPLSLRKNENRSGENSSTSAEQRRPMSQLATATKDEPAIGNR